ncbi:hypothetical protein [Spiroplasma endosymbiont of Nebria brevicollis]|uniref:hypothetical protein n=1 Tax=Spiroplasma endosymbiont of Nebria brevicollis TaxID=3066284 RepID=UPI00313D8371
MEDQVIDLINENKAIELESFLLENDINKPLPVKEKNEQFTPIICAMIELWKGYKEKNEENIKKYEEIIYLLCNYKGIKIDSESAGDSTLDYAMCLNNRALIECLIEHGARKFNGQELEPDEIMQIERSYELCEKDIDPIIDISYNNNSINNSIVEKVVDKLFAGSTWVGAEIINKIGYGIVGEAINIATTFFF